MALQEKELQQIHEIMSPIIEEKPWGASLGYGSFITMEFGTEIPSELPEGLPHGEWHLWIYCCAWHLREKDDVLVGSEDSREILKEIIPRLNGLRLDSVEISPISFETTFNFEGNWKLKTFPMYYQDDTNHWFLYTPGKMVLVIGPGMKWTYRSSGK